MIAPTDYPPHPIKGRIMLDGYNNCLIWEHSRSKLLDEEKQAADYLKSIARYSAPWNPKVGQKWLDLKTNRVMLYRGGAHWWFDHPEFPTLSDIPADNYEAQSFAPSWWNRPPPSPTSTEPEQQTKAKAKPEPNPEPEKPQKSRVFTLK